MNNTKKNNHELGIKFPKYFGCCNGINIYIDKEKINAISLYPLDGKGRRIEEFEEMDFEFNFMELEVRDIEDIAVLMNEETFDKFCELWRKHH